ncbi:MAG: hypothetical protein ACE5FF_00495 [Saprospiraceae bacterium]
MKTCFTLFSALFIASATLTAQNDPAVEHKLPYFEIPDYPDTYTPETVAARMIDGLGFRYYWATEGLRPEDLAFRPNDEARTSDETLGHILGLSRMIVNTVKQVPNVRGTAQPALTFEEKRKATLENLKTASDLLKSGTVKLEDCKTVFQNGDNSSEFPFWNQLNGPIADAIWHCGQVVSFRRSSGNPFNSKVSVFSGKVRE